MVSKLFVATKAFIVNDEGKVLIVRESSKYEDGAHLAEYDVPGGRVEPGQRFDESLRREIREEINLEIEIGKPFFVHEWRPVVRGEEWQVVAIFFKCVPKSVDVKLGGDHDAFEWIDPKEYEKYPIIDNLKPAFEAYLSKNS